jgi:hypothetical protein
MEVFWLAYFFWCVIAGFIGMVIGQSKGRGPLGFLLGFMLGIIGWIIVAVMSESYEVQQAKAQQIAVAVGSQRRRDEEDSQRRNRTVENIPISAPTPSKRDFRKEALAEVLRMNPSLAEDTTREGSERLQAELDTTQKHLELRSEVEALQADKKAAEKAQAAQLAAEVAGLTEVPTGLDLIVALRFEVGFTVSHDGRTVSSVERGYHAERIGLRVGDRLCTINGENVTNNDDLGRCVRDFRIQGGSLRLGVQRGSEFLELA